MATRILHVSDLHTGTREDPAVEQALGTLIETTRPELVIAPPTSSAASGSPST